MGFPRRVDGKKVGHICKKDQAREEVLALARRGGWHSREKKAGRLVSTAETLSTFARKTKSRVVDTRVRIFVGIDHFKER